MWRKRANNQQHLQLPTTTTTNNNHVVTITTPTPTSNNNNNNNSQLQRQILSRATTFANTTVAGAPIASVFNRRKHSVLTSHSILSHSQQPQQQQHTQQHNHYHNNNNNSNHNNENGNLMRDEDDEDDEFEILYDLDHHLGQQHQQQGSSSIQVSSSTKSLAHLRPFSLYENNNNKSSSSSSTRSSDRIVMSNNVDENDIDDDDDDESQALTMTLPKKNSNSSSREIQHSMNLISATPVSRLLSHDKLGHVSSDFNWFSADVVEELEEVEIDEEEESITVNVQTERTRQKTASSSNSGSVSESTRMVDVIQLMDDESSPVIVSQNISRVFSSASRVVAPSTTTRVSDETKTTAKKGQSITREQKKRESKQRSRSSSGSSSSGEKTSSLILDSEEELMDHDDDEEDFDHFFGGSKMASDRGNHKGPRRVLDQDKRHAAILNRRRTFEDQDIEDDIGSFSDEEGEPLHDMRSTPLNHSVRKDIRNNTSVALSSNVVEILSDSEDIGELADVFHRSRATTTTNKKRLLSAPDAYAHVPSLISARNDRYKHIVHGKRVLDDEIEDISDDETNTNVVEDEIQDVVQDVIVPPSQPATQQSNKFTKPTKPTQFISTQPVASWLTSLRVASANTIPLSTQGQENDMDVIKKIKSKFGYCGRLKQAVVDARNTIVTHDIQASEARRSSVMPTQTPSQILPALNSVVVRIIKDREEFSLYFATCLVLSSERSYGEYVDIVFTTATKNNMKLRPGRVVRIRGPFVDHSLYPRFSFVCSNATEERQFKDLSSASEIHEQVESLIRKFTCAMVSEDGEL